MIDFKKELNEQQLEAVAFAQDPLLILAGAGSGKTRSLIYRTAHLIQEQKLNPHQILLLTFTNKAAAEMQKRLKNLSDVNLPFAGTFHSFCAKLLRGHGHHLGIPANYVIYDAADQIDLIKQVMKQLDIPAKTYRPGTVLGHIGQAKHELLTPKKYAEVTQGTYQEIVAQVYLEYQKMLTQADALDFDDLLLKTVKLFVSSESTRAKFQEQFQHILIDEYQDTNKAQYLIAKILAQPHEHLTVVGDASQSIYKWRGADYRNLDYLKQDFPRITTVRLEQNYRSTQNILDAAYGVISRNKTHPILELWTDLGQGEKLQLHEAEDEKAEAAYVISQIKKSDKDTHSAILYRTNAQSRTFEEALIRGGLSYELVGGTKFYERKEIRDVLAYLRLVVNPKDIVSRSRAQKLGKRRLDKLESWASKAILENLSSTDIFDAVLEVTHYMDKYDPQIEADLSRIENIKELKSVATQFEQLADFLENVSLVENNQVANIQTSQAQGNITLMTIHASKGLEFDQVFVVGMEEGIFPHSRSLLDPTELEEERRLCYVALTRAKIQLHLTYTRNRLYFGSYQHGVISRFISEIPSHLIESTTPVITRFNQDELSDDLLDQFLNDEINIDDLLS